jgi:pimeloyl-ACP methyl ester carboxylesterase
MDRLVLLGESYGAYLAARAAAFEPRIKALVLNGGIYDVYKSFVSELTPDLAQLYNSGEKDAFDSAIYQLLVTPEAPTQLRWGIEQGLWAFKQNSSYDWLQSIRNQTVQGFVHKIRVLTWIASAGADQFFQGQPEQVAQAIGDKAFLQSFTGAEGYHVQVGPSQDSNRKLFAWLGSVFNN